MASNIVSIDVKASLKRSPHSWAPGLKHSLLHVKVFFSAKPQFPFTSGMKDKGATPPPPPSFTIPVQ